MSLSSKQVKILILFILIATPIFYFLIRILYANRCAIHDSRICGLVNQLKSVDKMKMHGIYEQHHGELLTHKIVWAIDQNQQEIIQKKDDQNTMHAIFSKDFVFLKDNLDQKWWKQKISDLKKYDIKLPFIPIVFFNNLLEEIQNADNVVSDKNDEACGIMRCNVLSLTKKNGDVAYIYLSQKTKKIEKIRIIEGSLERVIRISSTSYTFTIPKYQIKTISKNRNIFFENLIGQPQKKETKPKYVIDFEKEKSQNEATPSIQIQNP